MMTASEGGMATLKNDIMSATTNSMMALKTELKGDIKKLAIQMLALDAKKTAQIEALGETLRQTYSALVGRMDAFMSSTLKVQEDQTFHTHRLDVHDQEIKLIKAHIGLDPQGR